MARKVVSKGEFAELCKVDKSAVSRWIKDGKIKGAALVGDGRAARIDVEEAQRQLRISLDSAQRLGNGLGTRLAPARDAAAELPAAEPAVPAAPSSAPRPAPPADGLDPDDVGDDALDAELKREKLATLQRVNRRGAEEEAAAQGRYTETAAARRQMTVVAVQVLRTFEGAIPEVATGLAGRFKLEEREVILALNELFRGVREDAAAKAVAAAAKLDALAPGAPES